MFLCDKGSRRNNAADVTRTLDYCFQAPFSLDPSLSSEHSSAQPACRESCWPQRRGDSASVYELRARSLHDSLGPYLLPVFLPLQQTSTWRLITFYKQTEPFNVHISNVSGQGRSLALGCRAVECDLSLWKEPRASFARRVGRYRAAPVQTPLAQTYLGRPPWCSLRLGRARASDYVSHFGIVTIRPSDYMPITGH